MQKKASFFLIAVAVLSGSALQAQKPPAAGPDQFVSMAACRLLDTRVDPVASSAEEANRTIDVASTRCGRYVPRGATAYAIRRMSYKRVESDRPATAQAAQPLERHAAGAPLHFPVGATEHIAIDLEGFYVPASAPIDPFPTVSTTNAGAAIASTTGTPLVAASTKLVPRAESLSDVSLIGPYGSLYLDASLYPTTGFMGLSSDSNHPWAIMRAGDTGGYGGFGVCDLNGNELLRVASNGVTRLKKATLSGVTDYQESSSIAGETVHNVIITNPKDHLGSNALPVIFFNARSNDEAPTNNSTNVSPPTTKFQAYTLGYYTQQHVNFDSQFYYSWPQYQNHYYYRAWAAGEDNGPNVPTGKETYWVKAASSGDSLHHTRADMFVSGNVGIGTTSPDTGVRLQVEDFNDNTEMRVSAGDYPGVPNSPTLSLMRKDGSHVQLAKYGFKLDANDGNKFKLLYGGSGAFTSAPLVVDTSGNVGIGTTNPGAGTRLDVSGSGHFTGNVTVDGVIYAKYQDVAEWVPSEGDMSAGTVVILNPLKTNAVTPSTKAYDTAVAGVVSDQPGVLLGVGGENKAKIATTGRVKVRVDARAHAVHIGDLLVTSDIPGTAMLSEPLDLGGVKIHRPGTLVGKALEPLANGEGEILVLLSLH